MVSIIKSISVTQDESDFMDEYNLSPTQLLKEKVWELKGMVNKIVRDKIERLTNRIQELVDENEKLKNKDVAQKEE